MAKAAAKKTVNRPDFELAIQELGALKVKEKDLKGQIEKLTAVVKGSIADFGEEVPEKGHIVYTQEVGDLTVTATNQKRVSSSLVPEAVDLLRRNKMGKYLETIEIVREDRLQQDIESGIVKPAMAKELYDVKDSFALVIKVDKK